jgi:protein-S-isoprenylcysteine O-methyltransferase Ste14
MATTLLKTLIFTLLAPGTVTVAVPYWLLGSGARPGGPWWLIGVLLIALGAVFYLCCAWEFASAGQGTPAPIDPPKLLVARGLYRVVRNPMYLGVLLVLLGESLVFGSWALLRYAVLVWLCFHLFVVLYEEPVLRRKFGASYEDYCERVWRWTPRLPPRGRTEGDGKSI